MQENEKIIGQELTLGILRNCLVKLSRGQGSMVCITGEASLGKSFILSEYSDEASLESNTDSVFVQCQPPIGNMKISNLQPLLPFQRIVEKLEETKTKTARKRLAYDVGMTTLASVPIGGDLFYWVKEVGKAFETYKKEKKQETSRRISVGAEFYFSTIKKHLDKKHLAFFVDDMHWSDSQSIELLGYLLEHIDEIPLMFVFSANNSVLETSASPLSLFLEKNKDSKSLFFSDLESFTMPDIRSAVKEFFPDYKANQVFEDWIFQKSYGVPGVIFEYIKYFQKNTPFTPDGELSENFGKMGYLPSTVQSAFSETIEKLGDEERNILAICSAEGREFTAMVVSQLLNTDVLTAIKKLRSLQNKTRIIKSIGAKVRYGQTTTVYEFSQAFYQTFFENSLEYEEKVAIHGQIASILKKKFDDAESESDKQQIAPYVAAHSSAAGDDETTSQMLLVTAQAAKLYDSPEIMEQAYESFRNLSKKKGTAEEKIISTEDIAFKELLRNSSSPNLYLSGMDSGPNGESLEASQFIDFNAIRRIVIEDFLAGNFTAAADKSLTYFNSRESELRISEQAQLLSVAIRAYLELKDLSSAENYVKKAQAIQGLSTEPISECFVNNATALYYFNINKIDESFNYLRKAAQRAIHLPPEIRLLTIANIALIQNKVNPDKTKKYYNAVKKMTRYLNFTELGADIFKN